MTWRNQTAVALRNMTNSYWDRAGRFPNKHMAVYFRRALQRALNLGWSGSVRRSWVVTTQNCPGHWRVFKTPFGHEISRKAVHGLSRSELKDFYHIMASAAIAVRYLQPCPRKSSIEAALLEYVSPSAPACSEQNTKAAFTQSSPRDVMQSTPANTFKLGRSTSS